LREFGGTAVFEALSLGAVPVVADFGGPGDIVNSNVGYKIALTNEADMVSKLESVLRRLAEDRPHLESLRQQGLKYAREHLTFDGKARAVTDVLLWASGRASKPKLQPPERVMTMVGQRPQYAGGE
jgi:glycosyltransferase involved in cell wall biosynthesis